MVKFVLNKSDIMLVFSQCYTALIITSLKLPLLYFFLIFNSFTAVYWKNTILSFNCINLKRSFLLLTFKVYLGLCKRKLRVFFLFLIPSQKKAFEFFFKIINCCIQWVKYNIWFIHKLYKNVWICRGTSVIKHIRTCHDMIWIFALNIF